MKWFLSYRYQGMDKDQRAALRKQQIEEQKKKCPGYGFGVGAKKKKVTK